MYLFHNHSPDRIDQRLPKLAMVLEHNTPAQRRLQRRQIRFVRQCVPNVDIGLGVTHPVFQLRAIGVELSQEPAGLMDTLDLRLGEFGGLLL